MRLMSRDFVAYERVQCDPIYYIIILTLRKTGIEHVSMYNGRGKGWSGVIYFCSNLTGDGEHNGKTFWW